MEMTDFEIARHWRLAKERNSFEIRCLADLNAVPVNEMKAYLEQLGLYKPVKHVIDCAKAEELIRAGWSDQQIAKELHAGRSTISHFRLEKLGVKHRKQETRSKPVVCVETGQVYESQTAAALAVGRSLGAISNALRGASESAGGYHWRWAEWK